MSYQCACKRNFRTSMARDAHTSECPVIDERLKSAALCVELAAMREERDALAAMGESLKADFRKWAVDEGRWAAVEYIDNMGPTIADEITASRDAAQRKAGWVDAIDEELIVRELSPVKDDETAKEAIHRLVGWEIMAAQYPTPTEEEQRKAGALWALKAMRDNFAEYAIGGDPAVGKAIRMCEDFATAVSNDTIDIERGEVKP